MALSGSAPSDFSSASCSRVNRLEVSFFIGFPFVGGGLPRADDAADRLAFFGFGLRPGVNHQQQHRPDKSDSVPAISLSGCESGFDAWSGSSNTSTAVSNDKPCLTRFSAALSGSHVQRTAASLCSYKYGATITWCQALVEQRQSTTGRPSASDRRRLAVFSRTRGSPGAARRMSGWLVIAPHRSNSAHLHRPWRAILGRVKERNSPEALIEVPQQRREAFRLPMPLRALLNLARGLRCPGRPRRINRRPLSN